MPYQMALDEALLKKFIDQPRLPQFRFFYASSPWVTVGFSFKDPMTSHPNVCRRITGGGRVVHGNDLIFSLIAGKGDDESFKSVRISYWKIHEAVKIGFELLNLKLDFYRCDQDLPSGPECFNFPIATDLSYQGRKIAGGAQKRSRGAFLHQESVQIPKGIDEPQLEKALLQGFQKVFEIQMIPCEVNPDDLRLADQLSKSKYEPLVQQSC